jgi:hypothetical protein
VTCSAAQEISKEEFTSLCVNYIDTDIDALGQNVGVSIRGRYECMRCDVHIFVKHRSIL